MADSQRKTANLFDDEIANGYYNDSGVLVPDSTTSHSTTYIPVNGTTYTVSGLWYRAGQMANFAVYEWDNNKNWLRRSNRQYPPSSNEITFTIGTDTAYITLQVQTEHGNIMLNTGSTPLPYESYWQHSLRKLTTATDIITSLPVDLYADGNSATVGLVGNMTQSGTPTPSSPIQPSETGERTENLYNYQTVVIGKYINAEGEETPSAGVGDNLMNHTDYISITSGESYYFKIRKTYDAGASSNAFCWFDSNKNLISRDLFDMGYNNYIYATYTAPQNAAYLIVNFRGEYYNTGMLNIGDTAAEFEPYGYKIPISSANTTTPVYLGEVETTRKIKQLVLTGNEDWALSSSYAGGFYLATINPDYMRDENSNLAISTHYITDKQTASIGNVNQGHMSFSYTTTQRLYIRDTNYATTDAFKAYLQAQYAAGTPVTVWYVLATETTGIVNEPIRKIGNYADTVSGISIPTITGADSFDVLTTLKPSEVDLTYHGWHDASAKEWDGSQWQ